ncbi:hypothetical protein KL905_003872 [Ogataea polymorpha]|nr:hypothetical protein KL907_004279 [Ogataea polymorpha]KAG7918861.1 hypothetical protein KL905_003872 [Ogataea polymorpha]KAG7931176.1 hypothetical protein KL934_004297 [Ogataea polymorpha]
MLPSHGVEVLQKRSQRQVNKRHPKHHIMLSSMHVSSYRPFSEAVAIRLQPVLTHLIRFGNCGNRNGRLCHQIARPDRQQTHGATFGKFSKGLPDMIWE